MGIKVYIAAPFFNPGQTAIVEKIESALDAEEIEYYSPRSEGVLIDHAPEDRAAMLQGIFNSNIKNLDGCDLVLAVVDGRDIGTIWEMGMIYGRRSSPVPTNIENNGSGAARAPIVTYTEEGFGLNVMIQQSVSGHLHGESDLTEFCALLKSHTVGDSFIEGARHEGTLTEWLPHETPRLTSVMRALESICYDRFMNFNPDVT